MKPHRPRKDHKLQEWQVRHAQLCARIRANAGMLKDIAAEAGVEYKTLASSLRYSTGKRRGKVTQFMRERALEIRETLRTTPTAVQLAREWNVDPRVVRSAAAGFTYKRLQTTSATSNEVMR